jgi:hypothetical protein
MAEANRRHFFSLRLCGAHWLALLLAILFMTASLHAQEEDFDQYKVRIDAFWFYSSPSVTMEGEGHNGFVNFDRDFGFNTYSTFAGKLDWKFTRKNHLYVVASPFIQSRTVMINRTINFRGETFPVGTTTTGKLQAILIAPGYQYDIFRRKRWHLGIAVQIDLFDTKGTLNAAAQVNHGAQQAAIFRSASLLAPVPVAGPEARAYLTRRLFVEGNIYGMYLFGYGNFISTAADLGLSVSKHLSINAGYEMGSRLRVNDSTGRIGLSLTQKGPIVGAEISF